MYYIPAGEVVDESALQTQPSQSGGGAEEMLELWHRRLGHVNHRTVAKMLQEGGVEGAGEVAPGMDAAATAAAQRVCETCVEGGMTRSSFPTSERSPDEFKPGEQLHLDFEGPFRPQGQGGERWSLEIRDRATGLQESYPSRTRSYGEARLHLEDYINRYLLPHGHVLRRVRADGEGCFSSRKFKRWASKRGVVVEYTTRATSQSNGRAEAGIKVVARKTRSMLVGSAFRSLQ